MSLWALAAWLLALLLLVAIAYRWVFTLAYLLARRRASSGSRARAGVGEHRFTVLVPAHDEEAVIGELIASVRSAAYPADRIELHVVADNCSDATAARARALGAVVHERRNPQERGKGQALAWGLQRLEPAAFDAVAVIDADNVVDPAFFAAMSRELGRGRRVLQGYDGLANPDETMLTRLIAVTSVMKNQLFYGGKTALGLPILLMGTGMVFHRDVLAQVGWQAGSISEDIEQSLRWREMGEPIRFVEDAKVLAREASSLREGYGQRQRWASGRYLVRRRALGTVLRGLRTRHLSAVEAGVEVLMPTYSEAANLTLLAGALALLALPTTIGPALVVGGLLLAQAAELAVALRVMRASRRFVSSILLTPVFLIWKAAIDALALLGFRRSRWVRGGRPEQGTR